MKLIHSLVASILLFSITAFADPLNSLPVGAGCQEGSNGLIERIEGSDYAAIGIPVRYKADLSLPSGVYKDVEFGSSESGVVGSDNAGVEGNAYKNITFNTSLNRGVNGGVVWADAEGPCAYKFITVHDAPSASISSNYVNSSGWFFGSINANGSIDSLSKSGLAGVSIKYQFEQFRDHVWTGLRCDVVEETARWETVQALSTNNSFDFEYRACPIKFRVRSYDGTFYSAWANISIYN